MIPFMVNNCLRSRCPDCGGGLLDLGSNMHNGEQLCIPCDAAWLYDVEPEVDWS